MYRIEELAAGVYARIGGRPLEPNSGIIVGDEGVTVIDSGWSPAAARELAADIARMTPKPVTTVIISHHHFDHAWGNQVFIGARIIGHAGAHAAMTSGTDAYVQSIRAFAASAAPWYGLSPEQFNAAIDDLALTPPTATYTDALSLWTGGRELRLSHPGPGHTFGDTLIELPAERLLFAGDLVCNHLIPVVGDGDPLNFGHILDGLGRREFAAIVPGHGPLMGRHELGEFTGCLRELTAEVAAAREAGAPDPRAAFQHVRMAGYGDWSGHEMLPASVRRIYRSLEAAEREGRETADERR